MDTISVDRLEWLRGKRLLISKKLLTVLVVVLMAGAFSLWFLKAHSLEIVHAVVVNALVQKAPEGYDQEKIKRVLNEALARAENQGSRERYLEELQTVFHNLEKRQYLETEEMDRLMRRFSDDL